MIASVRGTVLSVGLDRVVIDVGGVGLAIRATPSALGSVRQGEEAALATSLVVREDSLTLFGFDTVEAKDLFELVQSVSGVGPKIALALLSVFEPDDLVDALAHGDTTALQRTPGIGRKSAERLVLELGDKVSAASAARSTSRPAVAATVADRITEALTGLGFTAKQAAGAVAEVTKDADDPAVADRDVGLLLRRALALLGKRS